MCLEVLIPSPARSSNEIMLKSDTLFSADKNTNNYLNDSATTEPMRKFMEAHKITCQGLGGTGKATCHAGGRIKKITIKSKKNSDLKLLHELTELPELVGGKMSRGVGSRRY